VLLSCLARLGLGYLVQQALDQSQENSLGRGRDERRRQDDSRHYIRYEKALR
jgi:hypothetical protein